MFGQILVVLAKRGGFVFPILCALLPGKSRAVYDKLFNLIRTRWPALNPLFIATDYEIALFSSILEAWPDVQIHGCLYHLNHSLKRKVADLGIKYLFYSYSCFFPRS